MLVEEREGWEGRRARGELGNDWKFGFTALGENVAEACSVEVKGVESRHGHEKSITYVNGGSQIDGAAFGGWFVVGQARTGGERDIRRRRDGREGEVAKGDGWMGKRRRVGARRVLIVYSAM